MKIIIKDLQSLLFFFLFYHKSSYTNSSYESLCSFYIVFLQAYFKGLTPVIPFDDLKYYKILLLNCETNNDL